MRLVRDIPPVLWVLCAACVVLPAASGVFGMYDRVTHWGKFVHGAEGGLGASIAALVLLGYRDHRRLCLPTQLAALCSMAVGIMFGASWEVVEFLIDWVRYSDLQKSNLDTMTDMLWSNLAAVVAGLLMVRLYARAVSSAEREAIGACADALSAPLGRLLDQHGRIMTLALFVAIAAFVASLWFAGRPVPGLPID